MADTSCRINVRYIRFCNTRDKQFKVDLNADQTGGRTRRNKKQALFSKLNDTKKNKNRQKGTKSNQGKKLLNKQKSEVQIKNAKSKSRNTFHWETGNITQSTQNKLLNTRGKTKTAYTDTNSKTRHR